MPVAGIASLSLFLGIAFKNKKKLIQSMDTVMARRGYIDGKAWIQRWQGVAIATSYSWVCILKKNLYRAWIHRRPGVDIATA